MSASFGDRLAAAIAARGPLCVGLDPYPDRVPALFGRPGPGSIEGFFVSVIARLAGRVAAIKPQIALFERWGPEGLCALARLTERAADAGLLVILDAKRGDIGATATGYAEAYLGADAWLHADAVTVNAYMGRDTLEPWLKLCRERDRGIAVLVRTSNPGAADLQALDAGGRPVWARVAEMLTPIAENLNGASGWSSVMAVVGATAPHEARDIRDILPTVPFLVPGYGAQGASAADAMAGAVKGQGVLVNASRAVLYPKGAADARDVGDWATAFDAGLEAAIADLASVPA